VECSELTRDRRGRDRMVVGFTIFITETCGVL
jgi:predicted RNA-binding protein with TRAM domain